MVYENHELLPLNVTFQSFIYFNDGKLSACIFINHLCLFQNSYANFKWNTKFAFSFFTKMLIFSFLDYRFDDRLF